MRRVYDICHTCRMCFSYCPSFPSLFDAIDRHEGAGEGEVEALTVPEMWEVVDECFGCKLCYVKCPYTPPHKFDLDFPRLMLRAKAVRARRDGVTLQNKILGDPDRIGRASSGVFARMVNWSNERGLLRRVVEKVLGIHRDRVLPKFTTETFESWMKRTRSKRTKTTPENRVVVFESCTVNYQYTGVGIAAVQVLERNGHEVVRPKLQCCGMPALDGGDFEGAVAGARHNVEILAPLVRDGVPIVVLGPTCGYMMKKDWPELLDSDDARLVAANTFDIGEYLAKEKKEGRLDSTFDSPQGKLAYHIPCHLRAQNIGQPFRTILGAIPGTQVECIEECSAFDGTWGMKTEHYADSRRCAGKLCRQMSEADADRFVSDCMLAGLNVVEELGRAPVHPIEVLRDAYGLRAEDAE